MTLELDVSGNVLTVKVSGKLTREDYERFVPQTEQMIAEHGKIRVLFEMHDFHGWKLSALWEDMKFDLHHFSHIERLAFVGEKKWEEWMSRFCRPFTSAEIRYFDRADAEEAGNWIKAD